MYLFFIMSIATLALADYDQATDQIVNFTERNPFMENVFHQSIVPVGIMTAVNGAPVFYNQATNTMNSNLLYNMHFMDAMSSIVRERINERVVHSIGSGAFGYFEVTQNISHICKANFLDKVGKRTPIAIRFSPSIGEKGFTELNRDFRGFSVKFYTKEGNLDIIGSNIPVTFIKDPIYYRSFSHAGGKNKATNLRDVNAVWDAITLRPESIYMALRVQADAGIPKTYRHMPGFGIHLYQVENKEGTNFYLKFHFLPKAGIECFTSEEASILSVEDSNYHTRDLYRAIAKGDYPIWTMYVQIMCDDDLKNLGPRAYDVTRHISEVDFPLHEVGILVLNRNAKNYHAEIEQLAYSPANVIPGIIGRLDKLYESRVIAYKDATFYRLGINAYRIPVNSPHHVQAYNYYRDGIPPVGGNGEDIPNYYPNSFNGPIPFMENRTNLIKVKENDEVDNFDQAAEFYEKLSEDEQNRLVTNLITSLSQVTEPIQTKAVKLLTTVHNKLGSRICEGLSLKTSA